MQAHSNQVHRIAIGSLFFFYGLCFASWASRIPSIQQNLKLSEAALGGILFALPIGLFVSLPLSGWLIAKIGSRRVVLTAGIMYSLMLLGIGFSDSVFQLVIALTLFGFSGNMLNVAANTQAVSLEARYVKPIMATFHGMWSLAGFAGAAIGTFMIAQKILPSEHYLYISAFSLVVVFLSFTYLLHKDVNSGENQPIFSMPDKALFSLGAIAFCSMMCEGAMFDWSGVYFKKAVMVSPEWVGAGYTAFMITMAGTRFLADWFTQHLGLKRVLQLSGLFTAAGLLISVVWPTLVPAIIGFLLVGIGVSSVVPLVYSAVGKSKTMSPGVAIAAVSTLGFFGLLVGPPVIGLVAGATSLRISFTILAFMGLCVTFLATKTKY